MLKFCLDRNNYDTKYQEIVLPFEEIKYSNGTNTISGVFDRKYKVLNDEVVSFLTPNTITYTDANISTVNFSRTGHFIRKETFKILEVSEYINGGYEELSTTEKVDLGIYKFVGNEYIKQSEKVAYNKIPFIKLTKRYVLMPNGKIYYETYALSNKDVMPGGFEEYYMVEFANGEKFTNENGGFNLEVYSYDEFYDDSVKLLKPEIHCDITYYVDNNVVTYDGIDYEFESNYEIDDTKKVFSPVENEEGDFFNEDIYLPITDEYGNIKLDDEGNEIILKGFTEYKKPKLLTRFEIERPEDSDIDYFKIDRATKFYFIEYKGEKYDFEFIDGKWQVKVPIDNECCDCENQEEKYETIIYPSKYDLTYNYDSDLGFYPTTILIHGNRLPILEEYRTTLDGDYLFIYTSQNYSFDTNSKLIFKLLVEDNIEYAILKDLNHDYYINYSNKRIYLQNSKEYKNGKLINKKNNYRFTICKYETSKTVLNDNTTFNNPEGYDTKIEEFDVTMSDSEYYKYLANQTFRVKYIDSFGNETLWEVNPSSTDRDRAYKIGTIIDYDVNDNPSVNPLKKNIVIDKYKFNAYRYCIINGNEYRANFNNKIGDDESLRLDSYKIIQNTSECRYDLKVISTNQNRFICKVDIPILEDIIDYENKFTDDIDINNLPNILLQRYYDINYQIMTANTSLSLKNTSFGIEELPYARHSDYNNILDSDFFHLYKKINYFSFGVKLESSVENNLLQEDTLERDFFSEEKEKNINPIIDMEKDMYFPVIKDENGDFQNIYEIQFNLHLRTRDLETWKIKKKTFSACTLSENDNLTIDNWNIFDNYHQLKSHENDYMLKTYITKDEVFSSDLLYFLNFTEEDVFYQKSRVGNSFIRLLFYDSPDMTNQHLLHMSTVFLNENELYKKYINNIDNESFKKYDSLHKENTTYCNVNSEPVSIVYNMYLIFNANKSSFSVTNWINNWKGIELTLSQLKELYKWFVNENKKSIKDEKYNKLGGDYVIDYLKNAVDNNGISMHDIILATKSGMKNDKLENFDISNKANNWKNIYGNYEEMLQLLDWMQYVYELPSKNKANYYKIDEYNNLGGDNAYKYLQTFLTQNYVNSDITTYYYNTIAFDYKKDRLDCSFKIVNRDESDTSSEGFYIYMFKEYGYKLRPSEVYMKVEFNHAGEGKSLQFFMPTIDENGNITCMVESDNSKELTTELENEKLCEKFKEGIGLNKILNYQYVKLNVEYDERNHRYVYYMPTTYMNTQNNESWSENKLILNLWELKFKDESYI